MWASSVRCCLLYGSLADPCCRVEPPLGMVSPSANPASDLTDVFSSWVSLKYPMKRNVRAKLARLYFELSGPSPTRIPSETHK